MEHLDLDEHRSNDGSMSSLPVLCDLPKEGSVGAILKLVPKAILE